MIELDIALKRKHKAKESAILIQKTLDKSPARVYELSDILKSIQNLPSIYYSYFEEALFCLSHGKNRSAIVFSWAGFVGVFIDKLFTHSEEDIKKQRNKWKFEDSVELRERYGEFEIIQVARDVKFITEKRKRHLHASLTTRNDCAHPSTFIPSFNVSVGFVDQVLGFLQDYL